MNDRKWHLKEKNTLHCGSIWLQKLNFGKMETIWIGIGDEIIG